MTLRKVFNNKNNQLIIDLPESFRDKKQVLVIVDDNFNSSNEKMDMIKKAATDPLFLSDINEVNKDFGKNF